MSDEKETKEVNVKRIFFSTINALAPCYELENGDIKKPCFITLPMQGTVCYWVTDKELVTMQHTMSEQQKAAQNKLKLVRPDGSKLIK